MKIFSVPPIASEANHEYHKLCNWYYTSAKQKQSSAICRLKRNSTVPYFACSPYGNNNCGTGRTVTFLEISKWQTYWTSKAALEMSNEVALRRADTNELLGLMAYIVDGRSLAVEIVYVESADHINTNLLREKGRLKKYIEIAKALFAYAVSVSI